MHHRTVATTGLLALGVMLAAGCMGPRNFTNENDRLRAENLELRKTAKELEASLALREGQISRLQQQLEALGEASEADVPRLAALKFAKLSGAVDTDADQRDDLLRLYIRTLDQQGRFMPVAGSAVVQVVAISSEGGVHEIASVAVDRQAWNRAYRSGITGTHYTIDIPLPAEALDGLQEVTAKLTFRDADSGVTFTAQRVVSLAVTP